VFEYFVALCLLACVSVVAYDMALDLLLRFGLTRRMGLTSRFVTWLVTKVFPRVNWPDDYGEFRSEEWRARNGGRN
jgi:hypothetical protein